MITQWRSVWLNLSATVYYKYNGVMVFRELEEQIRKGLSISVALQLPEWTPVMSGKGGGIKKNTSGESKGGRH